MDKSAFENIYIKCYFSSAVVRSYQYLWSAVVNILLRDRASCRHVIVYHMYNLGLQSILSFAHPYRVRQTKLLSKLKIPLDRRAVGASKPSKYTRAQTTAQISVFYFDSFQYAKIRRVFFRMNPINCSLPNISRRINF